MPPENQLHPQDEKILTAKALAYDVLSQHEHVWSVEENDLVLRLKEAIQAAESLPGARNRDVAISQFLHEHHGKMQATLTDIWDRKPESLRAYLAHLLAAIQEFSPVSAQTARWLEDLTTIATKYFARYSRIKPALPRIVLIQDVKDDCVIHSLSGMTDEQSGKRVIFIYYFTTDFHFESYFSISYVLSHEFWCHALSKLPPATLGQRKSAQLFGCSPNDMFEEGWMDYVHHEILQWEMSSIAKKPGQESIFENHSEASFNERNDRKKRPQLYYGVLVAQHFHKFLQQQEAMLGVPDGNGLFFQISMDLNASCCLGDRKADFVVELGVRLGVMAPGEEWTAASMKEFEQKVEASRIELVQHLKAQIHQGSLEPEIFIKSLNI